MKGKVKMEIEIKLKVTKNMFEEVKSKLEKEGKRKKEKEQHDIYFSPENPNFFGKEENDECLRIRIQNDKYIFCYKKIIFGNQEEDIHLIEHETVFESLEEMKKILACLNIKEVITLHKKRISYIYQEIAEISFDEVDDLGYFIELEILDSKENVEQANIKLQQIMKTLGLNKEDRDLTGYANALYQKKQAEKCID